MILLTWLLNDCSTKGLSSNTSIELEAYGLAGGSSLSIATISEMQGGGELSQAMMEDLWNHDPHFVADTIKLEQEAEEAMLAKFEA